MNGTAVSSVPVTGPLWTPRSLGALGVALGLGVAGLVGGWFGTANSPATDDAVRWVTLTVASLVLAVFAGALWVTALRRRIGLRRAALLPATLAAVSLPAPPAPAATGHIGGHVSGHVGGQVGAAEVLVASARMRLFHRPDCRLARGKDVRVADRATHGSEGRAACPVCAP